MCYLLCQAQKITNSNSWINQRWRPRWRPLLMTSRASSSATTHKIYLILLRNQRPSTEGKIAFRNTATYHGGGMNLRVRLRVNSLERQKFVSEKRQQSQIFCCPIVTCKYGILGQKAPQQGYENWNQTHFLLDKDVEKSVSSVLVKYDKSISYHHISLNTFLCTFCRHGQIITFIKSQSL